MDADFFHEPVMLKEVIDWLCINKEGIYVDGTVGGAGHAYEILKSTNGFFVGIDCDDEALLAAEARLAEFGSRKVLVKANFAELGSVLEKLQIRKVDGVLLDLGVSSHQLDRIARGFSFNQSAPLDMRMDRSLKISAYDIVNSFAQKDLEKIIRTFGEEKMASRIARAISQKRLSSPLETTVELAAVIASAMPAKMRRQKIHPATRTFQAIRIAVNNELESIRPAINSAVSLLNSGGRIAIISFHSLEDRIVKNEFRALTGTCSCPKDVPICTCKREAALKVLTKKALIPATAEIAANPRSRSAKLRVAQRV
ncbi:MAG: 16S rRNA (cytosine(1402)-N(4))-methyltransferase [Deltaproteobacteria bacterium HGW-Deltaproteobacteria-12]|jgi:16S rRNA (cytosine1402-N4)-methyltransferase|nr:MAG: 16S rRNA (cytosine(1402)-N(4))-methyltransferase [Deltaproteobacteria bacterium HGW-Deltaproteobacteria-12]